MSEGASWISISEAVRWLEQTLGQGKALDPLLWRAGEQAIAVRSRRVQVYQSDGRGIDLKGRGASGNAALIVGLATAHSVKFGGGGKNRLEFTTIDRLAGDDLAYSIRRNDGSNVITFTFMGIELRRDDVAYTFGLSSFTAANRMTRDELKAWIEGCGIENYKAAYETLRIERGKSTPNREYIFMPVWREVKGHRKQGRPPKKLPD